MFYNAESILSEVHSCFMYNIYYQSCIHICVTVRAGFSDRYGMSEP